MKKHLLKTAVIALSLLFFCGCAKKEGTKTPEAFCANVEAEFASNSFNFDLVKEKTGCYIITVNTPKSLENAVIKYDGDRTVLSLNGAENSLDFKEKNSVFSMITEILDDSSLPDRLTFCSKSGNVESFSGTVERGSYEIDFSGDLPCALRLSPSLSATVTAKDSD